MGGRHDGRYAIYDDLGVFGFIIGLLLIFLCIVVVVAAGKAGRK